VAWCFFPQADAGTIHEPTFRGGWEIVWSTSRRQQIQLRGFTLSSVPEIWEQLRGVDLHSLQTGMDNVRNICGCPLAGLALNELFDASPVTFALDRGIVGADGNPEFANLPRKFNMVVTGCLENCTPAESQDLALVQHCVPTGQDSMCWLVGTRTGNRKFCAVAHGRDGRQDSAVQLAPERDVGLCRKHGRQPTLCRAVLSVGDELWTKRRRRACRTPPPGRAEEDTWFMALGASRWTTALVRGMLCNWMVTLGALMSLASRSTLGKVMLMWLPITTFFALSYEHSIVNMYVIPTGMLLGAPVSFGKWWLWNQLPVTLGNIVSATLFTGLPLFASYRRKSAQPIAQATLIDRPAEVAAAS
jgi:hypothetical protein